MMSAIKAAANTPHPSALTPQRALASALASQRIEGLELAPRAAAEFRALAEGGLSVSDLRQRLLDHYTKRACAT